MQDEEKIFSDEPIDFDPKIVKKIGKKKPIRAFFSFIKNHKLIFIILVVILVIGIGLYFLIPEIKVNNVKIVNLNTIVRLNTNQTVKLKTGDVSVKIVNFIDNDCPKDIKCFGSVQDVQYLMTIEGTKYATGSVTKAKNTEFDIETILSDYKTYADIKIIKLTK